MTPMHLMNVFYDGYIFFSFPPHPLPPPIPSRPSHPLPCVLLSGLLCYASVVEKKTLLTLVDEVFTFFLVVAFSFSSSLFSLTHSLTLFCVVTWGGYTTVHSCF